MDCVEDSGIDSDQQKSYMNPANTSTAESTQSSAIVNDDNLYSDRTPLSVHESDSFFHKSEGSSNKGVKKSLELQKKLEKQRTVSRKHHALTQQPKQGVLSRNRLVVPSKSDATSATDMQPLVIIDMDESEDEFALPKLSKKAQREITQQLIKDGYNLDLEPDDEDLDLIPPRPLNERCICCNTQVNCSIQ